MAVKSEAKSFSFNWETTLDSPCDFTSDVFVTGAKYFAIHRRQAKGIFVKFLRVMFFQFWAPNISENLILEIRFSKVIIYLFLKFLLRVTGGGGAESSLGKLPITQLPCFYAED